jgi:tetratricopeptide (TPR) repeat protein
VAVVDGNYSQAYEGSPSFPVDFIKKRAASGEYITDLTYGDEEWVVTMGKTTYTAQIYTTATNFPKDWIDKNWSKGYDITQIAYGQDKWGVVMSKGAGLVKESWGKRSSFDAIKTFIKTKWDEGKDIIDIAYGNGEWTAILAEGADYHNQTYNWGKDFPKSWVNKKYQDGYHITSMTYGQGVWLVVMSQHSTKFSEKYICSTSFPTKWVQEQWAAGKRVKYMHYSYEKDLTNSFQEYYAAAVAAAEEDKHDRAIYFYDKAILLQPNHATAYNNRAWSKYLSGQLVGSLTDVNKSIAINPQSYNYHTRGAIYLKLHRCREANSDFDKSIQLATDKKGFHYNDRAEAAICLGNVEDAIADYDRAIAIDPANKSTYISAKGTLVQQKQELAKPIITWDYPYNSFVSSTEPQYLIKACIHSEVPIESIQLAINETSFTSRGFGIDDDCTSNIKQTITLAEGKNTIEIIVKTAQGSTRSERRTIEYKSSSSGHYHALLIGVQNYDDFAINDLNKPIGDAEKMKEVLRTKYTFQDNDIHLLKNPTKDEILNKLIYLQERLSEDDNLLIFYSGHGIVKNEIGYWLPKDADKKNRSKWFSNSELRDYVNSIKTKHTLVIADACFSGSIFTGGYRDITEFACTEMEKITSRRAMTSGANTVVPDNSVFFKYLIKKLENNTTSCLSAETLYTKVKPAVIYNSPNNHIPQFGVMPQTGDEGGNFIFRMR